MTVIVFEVSPPMDAVIAAEPLVTGVTRPVLEMTAAPLSDTALHVTSSVHGTSELSLRRQRAWNCAESSRLVSVVESVVSMIISVTTMAETSTSIDFSSPAYPAVTVAVPGASPVATPLATDTMVSSLVSQSASAASTGTRPAAVTHCNENVISSPTEMD